jgi:hypothetical protein
MKMTNDNKLKIVTLSHNIKALCYILDKKTFSEHCVASGTFTEIESLFELAKEIERNEQRRIKIICPPT